MADPNPTTTVATNSHAIVPTEPSIPTGPYTA